ncbi:HAD superfamily hydrolase (TIGR01509 family) [Aequitasia blattaphilus]|uniref:HAD family phosphatase n=1 Tax=Aequitasia blattaphilus TaxID=2949332 RepID=A0ABT1EBR5_9FIRM|nr:HAD family phosphatase [Aequitasia blattaphilus]MCP1103275.1 HAD family phosphatase [Aequitasia blattaphilus]MCR8615915.1 HAD family phosphatase [Aequitasia blattaphilus]
MIQGLVFDLDGLLFDSERVVQRAWNLAGEALSLPGIGSHIYHTIGLNVKGREEYFRENISSDFPMDEFSSLTREAFYQIMEKEGIPLKPGAKELLSYAQNNHFKIALATSSRRAHALHLLETQGINHYFDAQVFGDMVQRSKPDPEIYQIACKLIEAPPSTCFALEDAPNGIRSAFAAGLKPVMIPDLVTPTPEITAMTFSVLPSLYDVIELLKL